MKRNYESLLREYYQIENDFLDIAKNIELEDDFEKPCYSIGSSKLNDFCIKVGTEVETLFREVLENDRFDSVSNIVEKRKKQNIEVYREVIEPYYELREYRLLVKYIQKEIQPFENFHLRGNPKWFKIYSKFKHDKTALKEKWNLKHSLYALGCLLILVINHPTLEEKVFRRHEVSQRVFDLLTSSPRYCLGIADVGSAREYVCPECGSRVAIGLEITVGGLPTHRCPNCGTEMKKE